MGRNYFSKAGGPYFINDGFSKHSHSPEDIKPDRVLLASILIGFGIVFITIASLLSSL